MINKEDVYKVLNSPYKPFVMLALEMVNLKDKERLAIELVDLKGNSELKASEEMNCSVNSVKNYRKKALEKMGKAWQGKELINKILEEN